MANYDNKLGSWFKELEKAAEERKAKKKTPEEVQEERRRALETTGEPTAIEVNSPVKDAPIPTVKEAQSNEIVAKISEPAEVERTGTPQPRPPIADSPALFDEADEAPVEDFLSFLDRPREAEPEVVEEKPEIPEPPVNAIPINLPEGTGEARPIARTRPEPEIAAQAPVQEPPAARPVQPVQPVQQVEQIEQKPAAERAPAVPQVKPEPLKPHRTARPKAEPKPEPVAAAGEQDDDSAEAKWGRLPNQLQTLFASVGDEVAQNSYKEFKESRASLIQRLLDPPVTLEEAARILNVCPTTVRRYTNRGILRHYRTAGNQRRFRLSEVLGFMESHGRGSRGSAGVETEES